MQLIERRIYLIRGHKVFIDFDPADLYGVSTKQLNQQVRRNSKRFPEDFMFRLTTEEADALRSQFVTSNAGRGGDDICLTNADWVQNQQEVIHRFADCTDLTTCTPSLGGIG